MAWITTIERAEAQSGNCDEFGVRTYTRIFDVVFTGNLNGPTSALIAPGIPFRKSAYVCGGDYDVAARLVNYRTDRRANNIMRVVCDYSTDATEFANPLDERARYAVSFEKEENEIVDKDAETDAAIVNSAGDKYIPGIERPISRPVIVIQKNVAYNKFNLKLAEQYQYVVNDAPWLGFDARVVRCNQITAVQDEFVLPALEQYPIPYWQLTFEFGINRDGWKKTVYDNGFRKKVNSPDGYKIEPIKVGGSQTQIPVFLNGNGEPLSVGGTPVEKTYYIYPKKSFNVFNPILV